MFRKYLISIAFAAIQRLLIDKIKFEPLKDYLNGLIAPAQNIAEILTDENPDNVTQLKDFWERNHRQIIIDDIELAKKIVAARVTNADVRELILQMLNGIEVRDLAPQADDVLSINTEGVTNRDIL